MPIYVVIIDVGWSVVYKLFVATWFGLEAFMREGKVCGGSCETLLWLKLQHFYGGLYVLFFHK